jgi:hypothetical protein
LLALWHGKWQVSGLPENPYRTILGQSCSSTVLAPGDLRHSSNDEDKLVPEIKTHRAATEATELTSAMGDGIALRQATSAEPGRARLTASSAARAPSAVATTSMYRPITPLLCRSASTTHRAPGP